MKYSVLMLVLLALFGFGARWVSPTQISTGIIACGASVQTAVKLHKYGLDWYEVAGLAVQECVDDGQDPYVPR